MIRLKLGINEVALTLTEKTTFENPTYLFEFENNQTHDKVYCISNDTSLYTQRYNKFNLEVIEGVVNPLLGQINLPLGDEYTYRVYAQHSTTNLDPLMADEVVEIGYMTYDKVMPEREQFENNEERAVYE